jgi:acyl dehydratase
MSNPVTNRAGKPVTTGDQVTVVGTVASVSGSGPTGSVVVTLATTGTNVTVEGQDVYNTTNSLANG